MPIKANPPIRVVVALIERTDRRILLGQRRRSDSSPLKWARELNEELGAKLQTCREITSVRHQYADRLEELEIHFYAARIDENTQLKPYVFEQMAWALPRELGNYDFLAANLPLVAQLATGRIKPAEILAAAPNAANPPHTRP